MTLVDSAPDPVPMLRAFEHRFFTGSGSGPFSGRFADGRSSSPCHPQRRNGERPLSPGAPERRRSASGPERKYITMDGSLGSGMAALERLMGTSRRLFLCPLRELFLHFSRQDIRDKPV
jgi:hypothetical protein